VQNGSARFTDYLKTYGLYVLPQHALTRVVYWLTRRESRFTPWVIRKFAKAFDVDMFDAVNPDLSSYKTFNAFFTRPLKPEARPIANGKTEIASPADGKISDYLPITSRLSSLAHAINGHTHQTNACARSIT